MKQKNSKQLYMELESFENRGITIWLDGFLSSSELIANQLYAQEEISYMRDYIFEEGVLKEIHFDRVNKQ